MDFMKLSDGLLRCFHEAIRNAIREDDAPPADDKKYYAREHRDFREWAHGIEKAMETKGMEFEPIRW